MKQFLSVSILVLIFCASTFAQEIQLCPNIKVISPDGKYSPGDDMPFSLSISDETKILKLGYVWEVSNGEISQGQGTSAITISTAGLAGTPVIVKVEIKGLPTNCTNTFSGKSYVEERPPCPPLNECDISDSLEPLTERLDKLVLSLSDYEDSHAFIAILFKNLSERKNINRIFNYLTISHKIPAEKIKFGVHKRTNCSKVNLFRVWGSKSS